MTLNCICTIPQNVPTNFQVLNTLIKCTTCNNYLHILCMGQAIHMVPFECPSCQLKKSDFFSKTIKQILPPKLFPFTGKADNKHFYKLNLDEQTINHFQLLQSLGKKICLMLRCLRLDSKGYENHFPMNCQVNINNKLLEIFDWPKNPPRAKSRIDEPFVFTMANTNTKSVAHFKKNRIFDIEKFFVGKKNEIRISNDYFKNDNDKFNYAISLDMVEFNDVEAVVLDITTLNNLKEMQNLYDQSQCEMFVNTKISLMDIYTRSKKIEIPARSINCNHFKVFDLKAFLNINKSLKTYNCPVCNKKAVNLYIDGFLQDWMKNNPEAEEILIDRNYNIHIVKYQAINNKNKEIDKIFLEEGLDMSKKDDINIHYNYEEDNPSIVDTNKQINSNIQMLSTANKNASINNDYIIDLDNPLDNQEKSNKEIILQSTNKNEKVPEINLEKTIDLKYSKIYNNFLSNSKNKDLLNFLEKKLIHSDR